MCLSIFALPFIPDAKSEHCISYCVCVCVCVCVREREREREGEREKERGGGGAERGGEGGRLVLDIWRLSRSQWHL